MSDITLNEVQSAVKNSAWVNKHRPAHFDDYEFQSETMKQQVSNWLDSGIIPQHLLFHGQQGTGKSSLINVLCTELVERNVVDIADIQEFNMSEEKIEVLRDKIIPMSQNAPYGKYSIIILEEMEAMSPKSQSAMKRIMEVFSDNVRFLATSNHPNKIFPELRSRFMEFQIEKHDIQNFMRRVFSIVLQHGVVIDTPEKAENFKKYVENIFPDYRKTLNTIQQNIVGNDLIPYEQRNGGGSIAASDYSDLLIEALERGGAQEVRNIRQQIVSSIGDDDVDEFYSFLWRTADKWSDDISVQIQITNEAKRGMLDAFSMADKQLCVTASLMMCENYCLGA